MIDTFLFKSWSSLIDLDAQLAALGDDRTSAANILLGELAALRTEDEIRSRLVTALDDEAAMPNVRRGRSVDDVALMLVHHALKNAYAGRSGAQGRIPVDWLLLVTQFASQANLFKAHGKLLEGLFYLNEREQAQARRSLSEALQGYGYEDDARAIGPASVCSCGLATISANEGEFDEAEASLQTALSAVRSGHVTAPDWQMYVEAQLVSVRQYRETVEALIVATSAADVHSLAAEKPLVGDRRVIDMLSSRALRLAARGDRLRATEVARIGDWAAQFQGAEADVRRKLADAAMYVNEYATAEHVLRSLVTESPQDPRVIKALGRSVMQQGRYEEAQQLLQRVVASSPPDAEALADLAVTLLHLRKLDEARSYASAALEIDPSQAMARTVLQQTGEPATTPGVTFDPATGRLFVSEELLANPDEAAAMISAAILRANPEAADQQLAAIAAERGLDYANRVALLAFGATDGRGKTSHFEKAEELFRTRRLPEAIEEYKLAIAENADHAPAYMGAGDCYYHLGKLNLATAFLEESIAIEPAPSTLRFLGDAHRKCGRYEQAIRAYERALEIDPSYDIARQQLEVLRRQIGEGTQ